jgi:hypothetical protein
MCKTWVCAGCWAPWRGSRCPFLVGLDQCHSPRDYTEVRALPEKMCALLFVEGMRCCVPYREAHEGLPDVGGGGGEALAIVEHASTGAPVMESERRCV